MIDNATAKAIALSAGATIWAVLIIAVALGTLVLAAIIRAPKEGDE